MHVPSYKYMVELRQLQDLHVVADVWQVQQLESHLAQLVPEMYHPSGQVVTQVDEYRYPVLHDVHVVAEEVQL